MMLRGLVLAAALLSALADIPVHCVHRDILGTWELMMGESDGDSSATCGHVTPDRIMTMVKHKVGPTNPRFAVKRTLTVEFKNPNIVVGPEGRQGVWTTVYDEGFDIELDGWNYFSFFRYSPKWQGASPTKAEEFNWHCDETVSGWYHLASAPRGKSSHSWGCFVARRVSRSVPLDSAEYAPEEVKKRGGMVSGEMVLSATVMKPARFAEAGLQQQAEPAENADGIVEQRTPVAAAAFAAAEAADGGRASVEDSLSHLLGGGEDAAVYGREGAGAVSFLETMAASAVTSDEAIRGLESREAAQAVVDRINADADAGLRMWRAEVPQHLLGISHDEARKRLGASSKDVRASVQEAKRAHRARVAASRSHSAQTGSAAAQAYAHAHGSVRANRRLGSRAHARTPDLSPQFGRHAAVAIDVSQYPKSLDWSQVAGGAYIPDVLDQGHCGSCYAAAATDAITARARIKAKGQLNAFTLSTQSVVQCSGHNQGCDGGYPYLVGKFGHEIGFVPAECMQYTGKQDLCPSQVACPQLAGYLAIWTAMGAGKHGETSLLQHSASHPAAHSNFLQVEEVQGGRGASRLRGEDAVVAALQAGAAAGSEGHVKDGSAAGPLGFAVHPHQIAAVSGERQLPQFRQHGAEGRVGATSQSQMEADAEALAAEFASDAATDAGSAVGVQVDANGDAEGMLANTYALDERLYISRYGYVGGYYGAGSESAMIKELQDGPLVVALNAPGDLFYYKGGIYHHDQKPEAEYDVTPISRFEKTNHAVMLVGYGEETVNGQVVKYWKLKNSWGKRWGEARDPAHPKDAHGQKDGGYFRMVRGTDCLAAESMAVVIDP